MKGSKGPATPEGLIRLYDDRVAVKSNTQRANWSVMRNGKWVPQQNN